MFIIEVLPIGRGVIPESLSYFSHIEYPKGTIIQAPVRKSTLPAIVTSVTEAFSMKAALRAATFSLRKLPEQKDTPQLSRHFLETAEKAALYYGTTISVVLAGMMPKEIREGLVPFAPQAADSENIPPPDTKPRIFLAPSRDRYNEYGRMVRESFAAKHSIMFVVPTIEHARQFEKRLSPGIGDYTVVLYSGQSTRTLQKSYATIGNEVHPLLIIATPQHACCVERADVGGIILEHERSAGYVGKVRPYLDYRFILSTYASLCGRTCVLADSIVRTEEIFDLRNGDAVPFLEAPRRIELPGTLSVISLVPDSDGKTPFSLLSKKLARAIEIALRANRRVFLYSARRGLSPLVACIDCGTILRDPDSGSPLALIRTMKGGVEERWLVSSVSGFKVKAYDTCPNCGGWRLRERGIGIQQVYDELTKHFNSNLITLFDHQTASTHKKAALLRDGFYANDAGGILLGTALALPYLTEEVSMSAVMSMDSLRAIPSWRQQEEVFNVLMHLREKTTGTVHIQTRADAEDEVFELARVGNIHDFYTQELELREALKYPPSAVFIHLAWKEPEGQGPVLKKMLGELFAAEEISLYSAPYGDSTGTLHYGLIRVPRAKWPNDNIVKGLRGLPRGIRVTINPDRIV